MWDGAVNQKVLFSADLVQGVFPIPVWRKRLLAGIIVPRALMPSWLEWVSNVLPASYALEALQQVGAHTELTGVAVRDIVVVLGFAIAALCLAAATLRRRTA